MAKVQFADVEELPPAMETPVPDSPRDRHPRSLQWPSGARSQPGDTRQISRPHDFPTAALDEHQ